MDFGGNKTRKENEKTVGVVETNIAKIPLPNDGFELECGRKLKELQVAYETYGTLTAEKDNVIFICHALSGDAHVAGWHGKVGEGTAGWWEEMVGPGKGIDTNHYFVVCANILGGCKGTTGPSSINPETKKPYGSDFPPITVRDIVRVHSLLTRYLGLDKIAAVIGGSFGGMQALEWTIQAPDRIGSCICIASATALSAQALAFDIVGRRAIMSDPNWENGDYYQSGQVPSEGLSLARKIGHITYLSPEMMGQKFGRERREQSGDSYHNANLFLSNFQVESYLEHQGEKFVARFDANSYLHITRAMDEYDLEAAYGKIENAFARIQSKILVVALSSDWLFPPEQSAEIANGLLKCKKNVSYCCLTAPHGHDAFLVDVKHLSSVVRAFLPWVGKKTIRDDSALRGIPPMLYKAYNVIEKWVPEESRVVDLGCGNGILMDLLAERKKVRSLGIDISIENIITVIDKGHDIFQADIDGGLAMIPDKTYDYAILSDTLQVVKNPRLILNEMVRVAREGIVSFPNFGKLTHRLQLLFRGKMPKSNTLPFEWYETPNIHLFTRKDFIDLCFLDGIKILEMVCIPDCVIGELFVKMGLCNLGAERVVARISKEISSSFSPADCKEIQDLR